MNHKVIKITLIVCILLLLSISLSACFKDEPIYIDRSDPDYHYFSGLGSKWAIKVAVGGDFDGEIEISLYNPYGTEVDGFTTTEDTVDRKKDIGDDSATWWLVLAEDAFSSSDTHPVEGEYELIALHKGEEIYNDTFEFYE